MPRRRCVDLNWLWDAELLGRIGRHKLAPILERLAPILARQGLAPPEPGLPDALYFPKLAAVLRAQQAKLRVCLDLTAGSAAPTRPPALAGARPRPSSGSAHYALRRDGPVWHLTFQGQPAVLKHEQGLCYVAEMLSRPREPVKKLSLATKYSVPKSGGNGGIEVYDPATGWYEMPASTDAVHQRSLAADDLEARRACQARAQALAERIRDPAETETARQDARAELKEISAYLGKDSRAHRDTAKVAGDAVRSAIRRLLRRLLVENDSAAGPDSVRCEFARHLQLYLAFPSGRYGSPKARQARGELTGCLLYEPPPGVLWAVSQPG